MRKIMLMLGILLVVGCTKEEVLEATVEQVKGDVAEMEAKKQFASLLERARWGEGKACLELAKCYHDGIGVKADFLGTVTMLAMADQYGAIKGFEAFIKNLPSKDNTRMVFETLERPIKGNYDVIDSIADVVVDNGGLEGYVLKSIVKIEKGDSVNGIKMLEETAEKGSTLADLLLCVASKKSHGSHPDMERLCALSDSIPFANKYLGDYYSGRDGAEFINEPLAEKYYLKADKSGCLGKRSARWLINYYARQGIQIDPREIERLKALSGNLPDEE